MEIKCILKARVDSSTGTSQRTGNPWRTDEYLAIIPGQFKKKIKFEVKGVERCKQWEQFFDGMPDKNAPVLVKFEIDAREVTKDGQTRWYNSIEAWDIAITTW